MLRRQRHHREDAVDPLVGHPRAEQVRHRADEDPARWAPAEGRRQEALVEEQLHVRERRHCVVHAVPPPAIHRAGVAVAASLADPLTVPADLPGDPVPGADRIQRRPRPRDPGALSHGAPPNLPPWAVSTPCGTMPARSAVPPRHAPPLAIPPRRPTDRPRPAVRRPSPRARGSDPRPGPPRGASRRRTRRRSWATDHTQSRVRTRSRRSGAAGAVWRGIWASSLAPEAPQPRLARPDGTEPVPVGLDGPRLGVAFGPRLEVAHMAGRAPITEVLPGRQPVPPHPFAAIRTPPLDGGRPLSRLLGLTAPERGRTVRQASSANRHGPVVLARTLAGPPHRRRLSPVTANTLAHRPRSRSTIRADHWLRIASGARFVVMSVGRISASRYQTISSVRASSNPPSLAYSIPKSSRRIRRSERRASSVASRVSGLSSPAQALGQNQNAPPTSCSTAAAVQLLPTPVGPLSTRQAPCSTSAST